MEKFDAIVVGAGLAGLSCAYCLAKGGASVLVLERGDYPGAKNMTGGRIYAHSLRDLLPDLWADAPFERHVSRETLSFMNGNACVSIQLYSQKFDTPPHHSYTVLRARFDQWLAGKAEEAGALIVSKMRVDELIQDDGKVLGIRSDGDEVRADVVIAADGALSLLARKLGLVGAPDPKGYAVGAKEIIDLPRGVIEDRFQLNSDEGAAMLFIGYPTKSLKGGGFIYTNRESVSLGVVVGIGEAMQSSVEVYELTEHFKSHPAVERLIQGGSPAEYSAAVIPEHGRPGPFSHHGLLMVGDAAGLCLNLGVTVRGMDYAIASGVLAARAVERAREKGDFSAQTLSCYDALLRSSFVLQDFRTFRRASRVLGNERWYAVYPGLACAALEEVMHLDGKPKERLTKTIRREIKGRASLFQVLRDLVGVYRTL